MTTCPPSGVLALPAAGVGEVSDGDDLVSLLADAWGHLDTEPRDGDVLVVTSKVVSKAEGRVVHGDRDATIDDETDRDVARRGRTRIVRTRHGFVMAAAGVDASNVEKGSLVLLPLDPDASARRLRDGFATRGCCVGVVVSDTSGRAWRTGQTDVALGASGLVVLDDHSGRVDAYGNVLAVTAPAVADEIASVAELATGKLSGSPACLVRGLERFVLPRGDHGPGAATLVRPEASDMFGLGAREAVVTALGWAPGDDRRGFGGPSSADELRRAIRAMMPHLAQTGGQDHVVVRLPHDDFAAGRDSARVAALVAAHGWRLDAPTLRVLTAVPDL